MAQNAIFYRHMKKILKILTLCVSYGVLAIAMFPSFSEACSCGNFSLEDKYCLHKIVFVGELEGYKDHLGNIIKQKNYYIKKSEISSFNLSGYLMTMPADDREYVIGKAQYAILKVVKGIKGIDSDISTITLYISDTCYMQFSTNEHYIIFANGESSPYSTSVCSARSIRGLEDDVENLLKDPPSEIKIGTSCKDRKS